MKQLAVDPAALVWRQVDEYVKDRIAIHTEICTSCTATDEARRHAAERIDELRMLMAAPAEAQRFAEQRIAPSKAY